jgi:hypothetical protein
MAKNDAQNVEPAGEAKPGKGAKVPKTREAKKAGAAKKIAKDAGRTHADRALGHIRAARRGQREISDPIGRAQLLLAEAHALALLDVADALGERPATD